MIRPQCQARGWGGGGGGEKRWGGGDRQKETKETKTESVRDRKRGRETKLEPDSEAMDEIFK